MNGRRKHKYPRQSAKKQKTKRKGWTIVRCKQVLRGVSSNLTSVFTRRRITGLEELRAQRQYLACKQETKKKTHPRPFTKMMSKVRLHGASRHFARRGVRRGKEGMTCVCCSDNVSSLGTNLLCSRHPSTTKRKNQGIPSLTRMKSKVRLQGASRHFARRDMKRGKEGVTCVFLSTTKDHPDPSQI